MRTTIKVALLVLLLMLLLPILLLAAVAVTPASAADGRADMNCHRHTFTRFLGVSPFPNVVVEVKINARACVWAKSATNPKHWHGQVIPSMTRTSQQFTHNGWASVYGLKFWQYDRYTPAVIDNYGGYNEAVAYYDKWRQCQNIGGIEVCPSSGSFVIGWEFVSPALIKKSDGSPQKWRLLWHEGKPGQDPKGKDANIYIRKSD